MKANRRFRFPLLELFTFAVVACAALIVLYPGGDRIAITWLTGREPIQETYLVRDTNPQTLVSQANPSVSELLASERNNSSILQPLKKPDSQETQLAADQAVESAPVFQSLTPFASNTENQSANEFQPPAGGVQASQIGFPRMPKPDGNESVPEMVSVLRPLNEPQPKLNEVDDQQGLPEQFEEDVVVREQSPTKLDNPVGEPIQLTEQELNSFTPVKDDSIAWNSDVADGMIDETDEIKPGIQRNEDEIVAPDSGAKNESLSRDGNFPASKQAPENDLTKRTADNQFQPLPRADFLTESPAKTVEGKLMSTGMLIKNEFVPCDTTAATTGRLEPTLPTQQPTPEQPTPEQPTPEQPTAQQPTHIDLNNTNSILESQRFNLGSTAPLR